MEMRQKQNLPAGNVFMGFHGFSFLPHRTRQKIMEALQGNEVFAPEDYSKSSRNYKISPTIASVEGNILFDSTGYMPKEVMLETTLKAFGYNLDLIEVGNKNEHAFNFFFFYNICRILAFENFTV